MDYIINNNKTQLSSNNNQPYNKKDNYAYDYYINGKIHIIVALSSLILGIVLMLLFWYNQNHYLIRYRGFKSAYVVGTVCFLNVFLVPVCTIKKIKIDKYFIIVYIKKKKKKTALINTPLFKFYINIIIIIIK